MLCVLQVHWRSALCHHRWEPRGWCSPNNSILVVTLMLNPHVTPHVASHVAPHVTSHVTQHVTPHAFMHAFKGPPASQWLMGCGDSWLAVTAAVTTQAALC